MNSVTGRQGIQVADHMKHDHPSLDLDPPPRSFNTFWRQSNANHRVLKHVVPLTKAPKYNNSSQVLPPGAKRLNPNARGYILPRQKLAEVSKLESVRVMSWEQTAGSEEKSSQAMTDANPVRW